MGVGYGKPFPGYSGSWHASLLLRSCSEVVCSCDLTTLAIAPRDLIHFFDTKGWGSLRGEHLTHSSSLQLNSQDSPKRQASTEPSSTSSSSDPILDFNISLAVAKERAHQKRSSKRAPQMDWSKKNELFSNL